MFARSFVASAAFALLAPLAGTAAQEKVVSAASAWVATPAASAVAAAAYVEVENPTMYDVYLVSAESEVAGAIELREGPDDTPKVAKELTVPAFGSLLMSAGGPHLMLTQLKRPLKTGETVPLILKTDSGVTLKVEAPVR